MNFPCLNFGAAGAGPIVRNDQGAGAGAARDFINFEKGNSETFSVDADGLPDPGGGDATRSITHQIQDLVADSDALEPMGIKFGKPVTITKISIWVDTDTADGSTNKQTFVWNRSSDDAVLVTYTTPAANPGLAQGVPATMGAVTNEAIGEDEYLYLEITKTSSGLAMSGVSFQIEYTLL